MNFVKNTIDENLCRVQRSTPTIFILFHGSKHTIITVNIKMSEKKQKQQTKKQKQPTKKKHVSKKETIATQATLHGNIIHLNAHEVKAVARAVHSLIHNNISENSLKRCVVTSTVGL